MSRISPYDPNVYLVRDGTNLDAPEVLEIKSAKQDQFSESGEENNWRTIQRQVGRAESGVQDILDGTTPAGAAQGVQRACRFNLSVSASILNNTWTTAPYDTTEFNTDTGLYVLQGAGSVRVNEAGIYQVTFCTQFAANNAGFRRMRSSVGGTQKIVDVNNFVNVATPTVWTASMTVEVAASQLVLHAVNQNSGAALNLDSGLTAMAIARL